MSLYNRILSYPIELYLGGNPKKSGNTINYNPCPICGHHDCFKVFINTNKFKCFSCKKHGTIFTLAIYQGHGRNVKEATVYLSDYLNQKEVKPEAKLKTSDVFQSAMQFYKERLRQSRYAMDYLTQTRKRSEYLIDELNYGYADGTSLYRHLSMVYSDADIESSGLVKFTAKYKADLFKKGLIIYPEICQGRCVDFTAKPIDRSNGDHPVQVNNEFKLGGYGFYGYDSLKADSFILVEGQEDRNSILECGLYDVAAALGEISERQINQIQTHGKGKTIYCCFDNDKKGESYRDRIHAELGTIATVKDIVFPKDYNDIDDWLKSHDYTVSEFDRVYQEATTEPVDETVTVSDSDYPFAKVKGCSCSKADGKHLFNFDTVVCRHKIKLDTNQTYGVFQFSGQTNCTMMFDQTHLNDISAFSKHLIGNYIDDSGKMLDTIFSVSEKDIKETYLRLQKYMIKQFEGCKMEGAIRKGIGNVSKPDKDMPYSSVADASDIDIWNYGNIVAIRYKSKDGVQHYVEMPFTQYPSVGNKLFELSKVSLDNGFGAVDRDKLNSALADLIKYYQRTAGKLLGWAVACVLHKHNKRDDRKTPILFLWGETQIGKSSTIAIIHSLFGLWSNYASSHYYTLGVTAGTSNYHDVILSDTTDGLHAIPFMFDEADKNDKGEHTEEHFKHIIGLYEGIGKGRSRRDAQSVTKSTYNTVMVVGSPRLPAEQQYVNRCVIIKMGDIDRTKPNYDIFLKNRRYLSGFALEVFKKIDIDMFISMYDEIKPKIVGNMDAYQIDSRQLHLNTMCRTGYELLVKTGIIPDFMTEDDWQDQVDTSMEQVTQTKPAENLFDLLLSLVGTHTSSVDWGDYIYLRHYPNFYEPYSELVVNVERNTIFNLLKQHHSNSNPDVKKMSVVQMREMLHNLPTRDTSKSKMIAWFPVRKENGYGVKELHTSNNIVWNSNTSMSKPSFVDKDPTLNYDVCDDKPNNVASSGTKIAWLYRFTNPSARGGENYDGGGHKDEPPKEINQ